MDKPLSQVLVTFLLLCDPAGRQAVKPGVQQHCAAAAGKPLEAVPTFKEAPAAHPSSLSSPT